MSYKYVKSMRLCFFFLCLRATHRMTSVIFHKNRISLCRSLKLFLFTVISLGLLIACNNEDKFNEDELSGNGSKSSKIARIDIKDASALFVAPANFGQVQGTRAASDKSDVLFEITKDGIIKQVTYLDESGMGRLWLSTVKTTLH